MSSEERCTECGGYRGLPRILHNDEENPKECTNHFHKTLAPVIDFPERTEPAIQPAANAPAQPKQSAPSPLKPVCPHCNTEGKIAGGMTDFGPFKVVVVRCGNEQCRKILGVFQPLGLEMVQPPSTAN